MLQPLLQLLIIISNPSEFLQVSEYLKDSFPDAGIHQAATLQKGIELLEKEQFDAILLDITLLCEKNKTNFFHAIYSKTSLVPIILLTGSDDINLAMKSLKNGAQDYIIKKDYSATIFKKSIQHSIAESKLQARLKKSEDLHKHLFHNNPLPICAYDKTLKFLMVNEAALNHYGYSKEEFMELTIDKLYADLNDLEKLSCFDDNAVADESDNYKTCLKHRKKNGEIIDVELKSHIIVIDNKEACLIVISDITERNRANKQLRESEEMSRKLMQANKDLLQFSYITSHNLRAPLSNLSALIQLLDIPSVADANTAMLLEKFEECTIKLNNTVNDLINILIIKNNANSKKEPVDIKRTFEKVVESVENVIKQKNVTIITDFNHTVEVNFNRVYLESILLNLVTNAVKYSSPKRIPEIKVITENAGEDVNLYFIDNGLGIDMIINKDKIFGLYQRFHDNADSIGLGLYMVDYEIRAMGGKIDVESKVDAGTTFIITFKNQ